MCLRAFVGVIGAWLSQKSMSPLFLTFHPAVWPACRPICIPPWLRFASADAGWMSPRWDAVDVRTATNPVQRCSMTFCCCCTLLQTANRTDPLLLQVPLLRFCQLQDAGIVNLPRLCNYSLLFPQMAVSSAPTCGIFLDDRRKFLLVLQD